MFPGATYENRDWSFTMEIVLIAKRNLGEINCWYHESTDVMAAHWCSSLAFEAIDMNELVNTVISTVL